MLFSSVFYLLRETCNVIPVQSWTGLEGSRRFKLPDFETFVT